MTEEVSLEIDSTNTDPSYWNDVLKKLGLSMSRAKSIPKCRPDGKAGARRDIIYRGTQRELEVDEIKAVNKKLGKKTSSGHGPDTDE